ncbi:negative regulator of systemic acquired resistance SNI1 isoform X1 [Ricinus communis]|uniref:negative regulator of systemic acquired resistance SNI1 isoform X1 n=1 Tax=Ricinus communis TaxID=3988 RepID=UPI000772899D|nr:negative regulator of systemic acquired resistance SNI1 isoform X1 [Ricinus communis]|eukprot:XP_015576871.1 negative regulator of systemic acquired resistance SNI1 isoform X1 [Ricinus communis]
METSSSSNRARGVIEANVLAIIETTDSKDSQDANDDRIAFLQAVRAATFDQVNEAPPTNKMREAVFQIFRIGKSLELIMESYTLLNELDKRFPRVYLSDRGALSTDLVVVEEAWSPFVFSLDVTFSEREASGKSSGRPFDSLAFHTLIQDLAELVNETNLGKLELKSLGKMLLFQYLINVLEGDFIPRNNAYAETMNWTLVRESFLSILLSSRRINYKTIMKDSLSIICGLSQVSAEFVNNMESSDNCLEKPSQNGNAAVALALPEVGRSTCTAVRKLLIMIMELDVSKKKADAQGCTNRADGVRIPLVEIILDEITYDSDMLTQFLQIFNEPKWKMEIILLYFSKYIAKPSFRTRRSNSPAEDDGTLIGVLKCFSNVTSTKSITKKISKDVVQMLLAHAFQAHLSLLLPYQESGCISAPKDKEGSNSLVEICENVISAFSSLKKTYENMEILPIGKEALFTAATILSMKS